jgi:L-arabinose isomerase
LYPELARSFEGFEEIPGAATGELAQLMNEVSTEDVNELIASYSEPISVKVLLPCKRQIRHHLMTKTAT